MYCKGCGVKLQTIDKDKVGYSPKEGSEYCQRCFRLIHYDDLTVSMRQGIDPDTIIHKVAEMDTLILWVVDLFDFEASMIPGLNRKFLEKDIILVATKRDLLPSTLGSEKLAKFVYGRLKEYGISIKELILTEQDDEKGYRDIEEAVKEYANGREVAVIGRANAGKSTMLNHLLHKDILTASKYPGTTLDFNRITHNGIVYIDTPGIEIEGSILMEVEENVLKQILPKHSIKPRVFQLKGDQSFALGGLVRIDCIGCEKASIVFYCSDDLPIHRGKVENADMNWEKHYGEMYTPIAMHSDFEIHSSKKEEEKYDVVVHGLGWIATHGTIKNIVVKTPKNVNVTFRKAML